MSAQSKDSVIILGDGKDRRDAEQLDLFTAKTRPLKKLAPTPHKPWFWGRLEAWAAKESGEVALDVRDLMQLFDAKCYECQGLQKELKELGRRTEGEYTTGKARAREVWDLNQENIRLREKASLRGFMVALGWLLMTAAVLAITLAALFPAV